MVFDVPTKRFTVTLKHGALMPRHEVEAVMAAHNEATSEQFEVVWDVASATPTAEAKVVPFRLTTVDGEAYDFGSVLGQRPAVVSFWASWCAPCVVEAPHLQVLHAELGDKIEVVGVSIDEPSKRGKLKALVKRLGLSYPVPLDADGAIYAQFNPGGSIPYTLVVNAAGDVTYVATNFEEGDEVKLRAAVEAIVSGP